MDVFGDKLGIDNLEFEFVELSKRERDTLVQMSMQGLESKNPRVFYQATAAAKFVGKDKRLINPLIKAFKRSRDWKRWLVHDVIKYFGYDEKIQKVEDGRRGEENE